MRVARLLRANAPGVANARRPWGAWCVALALAAAFVPGGVLPVLATPYEFIPVGDPIESELRILDVLGPAGLGDRLRLPRLGIRPLQWLELEGPAAPALDPGTARAISVARIERALARNASATFLPHDRYTSTPRAFARESPDGDRAEASVGFEGEGVTNLDGQRLVSGTGLQLRGAVQLDRWLAYTHFIVGRIDSARAFADPIFPDNDLIVHTEETYLSYTGRDARWSAAFGRGRWHWGPGEEASLVLSKTSAAMTGVMYRVRVAPLRADGVALSATLDQARGEQLAAHRLEWQPCDAVRLGATEAARYRASGWQPLYLVGLVPYVLVQRLLWQEDLDSLGALRNNILIGGDAAWRVAPGTRVYGELLIDDLHAKTGSNPNKYAYQMGWDGVGLVGRCRVTWGGEYTRLTRFVYTSFFGRTYAAQRQPIGFPTGPDARRIHLRGALDLGTDWQLSGSASRTDKGENDLFEPYLPGSPRVKPGAFEGVVEHTRDADLGVRWWPASGVDLEMRGGYTWIENADHARGRDREGGRASLAVRLVR